jgi:hypothetical protein
MDRGSLFAIVLGAGFSWVLANIFSLTLPNNRPRSNDSISRPDDRVDEQVRQEDSGGSFKRPLLRAA